MDGLRWIGTFNTYGFTKIEYREDESLGAI